jgi:hypothetical protein
VRVLYLSRADAFEDTSSLVIIAKSIIRHMMEQDPELFVTWVVPKGVKDEVLEKYVLSELPDPNRMALPGSSMWRWRQASDTRNPSRTEANRRRPDLR